MKLKQQGVQLIFSHAHTHHSFLQGIHTVAALLYSFNRFCLSTNHLEGGNTLLHECVSLFKVLLSPPLFLQS